jgi:signal transduction histidine kinase
MTRRFKPGDTRQLLTARERFLGEKVVSGDVRGQIRRSWLRSSHKAVRAYGDPTSGYAEFDPEARLLRVARPVLTRLAEQVGNVNMAVILTDSRGLVLERRASHSLLRKLDSVLLAPGHMFSEDTVGTNGIGTAAEDRRTAWVVGPEHYAEWLLDLSCAGAVIRNPVTGRIEGVLDLTASVEDTSPLMVPFISQAAREIEERLSNDALPRAGLRTSRYTAAIQQAEARAAAEERRRLARELHDSVSQALYGITLGVDTARDLLKQGPGDVAEPLAYVRELAATGLSEMRSLISGLRSDLLEKEGLVAALNREIGALEARHPVTFERLLPGEPTASLTSRQTLFRIGQEAMHNIVRHASATRVQVRLEEQPPDLLLEITDNGVGFERGQEFPGHFGLRSMEERALQLGGRFNVFTAPGRGTRITARVPVRAGTS